MPGLLMPRMSTTSGPSVPDRMGNSMLRPSSRVSVRDTILFHAMNSRKLCGLSNCPDLFQQSLLFALRRFLYPSLRSPHNQIPEFVVGQIQQILQMPSFRLSSSRA